MTTSDKFPTDFVPVSRPLVEELGHQAAYIFGLVWNYCRMGSGICNASHDTIANRAGMSRRSVIDYIEKLIKAGYIEDLTPDIRNAPHRLSTKKGVQILHSKERIIKEERPIEEAEGYAKSAQQNEGGMQNLHSRYAKFAQPGMQNLHKKRQSKKIELIDKSSKDDSGKKPPEESVEKIKGPITLIKETFLESSKLPWPGLKKEQSFWWSQFGEIARIFDNDSEKAVKATQSVVEYMKNHSLSIVGPKSIVNLCRQVAGGQPLSNGRDSPGLRIVQATDGGFNI